MKDMLVVKREGPMTMTGNGYDRIGVTGINVWGHEVSVVVGIEKANRKGVGDSLLYVRFEKGDGHDD